MEGIYKTARVKESHACNFAPIVDIVLHCKQQILGDPESFHPSPRYFGGIPCNAGLGGWHVSEEKGHGEREREREMLEVRRCLRRSDRGRCSSLSLSLSCLSRPQEEDGEMAAAVSLLFSFPCLCLLRPLPAAQPSPATGRWPLWGADTRSHTDKATQVRSMQDGSVTKSTFIYPMCHTRIKQGCPPSIRDIVSLPRV